MANEDFGIDYIHAGLDDVDAWDGDYQPPEPGDYLAVIEKAEIGKSKTGGNPQLIVEMKLLNGKSSGRTVRSYYLQNHEVGKKRTKALVTAVGKLGPGGGYSPSSLVGCQLNVTITLDKQDRTNSQTLEKETKTFVRVMKERPAA